MGESSSDGFLGEHYTKFKNYLESVCGILLGDNKHYLVSSRLSVILKEQKMQTLSDLVDSIRYQKNHRLEELVVDAMTTNETLWFRDSYPFSLLTSRVIPEIRQGKPLNRPLRIWSAAASTGQEAYSISMTIAEYIRAHPGSLSGGIEILATDISQTVLDKAEKGIYDGIALGRGLSDERKRIFFELIDREAGTFQIRQSVRDNVKFRKLNLLDSFVSLGKFDVIYCRNVLIYFSSEVKNNILNRMANQLQHKGFLNVGGTESIGEAQSRYSMIRCNPGIIYQLKQES